MEALRRSLISFLRLPIIRPVAKALLGFAVLVSFGGKKEHRSSMRFSVMQVGGREGADPYTKWLRARGSIKTIGIEPESSGAEKLKATSAYDHIVTQGLGEQAGEATLFITKAKGWCSLLKPDEVAIRKIATATCLAARPFEVRDSENITLATLDAISSSLPPIDFLQIDVQGYELPVLRGAVKTLESIGVVELEVRFYPIYENEPLFPEIHSFMSDHGFVLCEMVEQGAREFGEKYVEANACYFNLKIASQDPEKMSTLRHYARSKHALYRNKVLRLLCDLY
jgi:FkbM family methyltransferase